MQVQPSDADSCVPSKRGGLAPEPGVAHPLIFCDNSPPDKSVNFCAPLEFDAPRGLDETTIDNQRWMMNKFAIASLGIVLSAGLAVSAFAAEKNVTGTLEDSFCYVTSGAHGASHKNCATGCAKKGIPVALVEKGTDKMYILLPEKNASSLPDSVVSKMEDEVTVTGDEYSKGGITYLTVKSVK